MSRRLAGFAGACALLVLALAPLAGIAAERKTLILQGRTLDPDGFGLGGVRVETDGAKVTHVASDRRGEFSLTLELPDAEALRRRPYEVRIRSRRGDWSFALPQGDAVIGLQITVERDAAGERVVARSNHPRVAAAAARAVALEGRAVSLAAVSFVGVPSRTKQKRPPATPALTQVAKASLGEGMARVALEGPEVRDTPPVPSAGAPAAVPPPIASLPPAPSSAANATAREPRATSPASRAPVARGSTTPRPSATKGHPGDAHDLARREWAERERALERIRSEVRSRYDSPVAPASRDSLVRAARSGHESPAPRAAAPPAPSLAAAPTSRVVVPSAARLARLAGAPGAVAPRARRARPVVPPPTAFVRVPKARLYAVSPRRAPDPRDARREPVATATNRNVPPGPGARQGRSATAAPSPLPGRGTRAGTLVAALGGAAVGRAEAASPCGCRIDGTIAMPSMGAARRRARAIVSVAGAPEIADSVVVTSGEATRFRLEIDSCDPVQLRVRGVGSGLRLADPASASARCEPGRMPRVRLVVVPR